MKTTKTTNFKQIFEIEKYKLSEVNDFWSIIFIGLYRDLLYGNDGWVFIEIINTLKQREGRITFCTNKLKVLNDPFKLMILSSADNYLTFLEIWFSVLYISSKKGWAKCLFMQENAFRTF